MRVLIVHNAYRQRGGEEAVVEAEAALLATRGVEVRQLRRDNRDLDALPASTVAVQTLWSRRTGRELDAAVRAFAPDVVHVHNTFPLISPSVYWAAARAGVPVVQSLHNFRWLCAQGSLVRGEELCVDCVGHLPWRGVVRRCYRGSMPHSALLVTMLAAHRALGSFDAPIARYLAPSAFCAAVLARGGVPADRIVVRPNLVDIAAAPERRRAGALYVGRVTVDKGAALLAGLLARSPLSLTVVGDGPEAGRLAAQPAARLLGHVAPAQVIDAMRRHAYLLVPSLAQETFGRVVIEAFACGLPVLASRRGALPELIDEGRTGLLFDPNDRDELLAKVAWAEAHPEELRAMGRRARAVYEARFTPDESFRLLMDTYQAARQWRQEAA